MHHCFHGNTDPPQPVPLWGDSPMLYSTVFLISDFIRFLLQIDEHLYIHENPFFFVFQHSMWVVPDLNFLRGWDMLNIFFCFCFCRIYQYFNLMTINCKCVTHTTLNPGTTLFICHKLSFVYLINLMNDKSVN